MRRKFTYLLLSAFLLVGGGQAMADRHDNGGKARQEQHNNHRPGNNGNPSGNKNHNAGGKNHNGGNKNNGFGNKNHNGGNKNHFGNDKKHDNKHHNDKHFGKPGNHGHPGNQGKPGNQGRPGGGHNVYRPGNSHPHGAPVPPPPAPVMRPGAGAAFHPGPAMPPPPPPRLPHMVNYVTRGCHDVAVWQVDAETFLVKYRRGGRWYTRYVYPYAEVYGAPTLISVNWQPLSPWTLIPPIQLNINL